MKGMENEVSPRTKAFCIIHFFHEFLFVGF